MAIYHLSAKAIERAKGRSAIAAVAYRSGSKIKDERTGDEHDYTRKRGIMHAEIMLPGGGTADRAAIWNAVERHHKRGDAVVAREVEVALPSELTATQRLELARAYARELADRYGVAADVALHAPRTVTDRELEKNPDQYHETDPETGRRHNGNWHAHIMLSACHVQPDGTLGKKAVELDPIHCRRAKIENMADRERARWGELANAALERHGHEARIDHRSHAERGIEAEPGRHLGPAATGYERRTGEPSWLRQVREQEAAQARLEAAATAAKADASIIDLETQLRAAVAERDRREGVILDALHQWRGYLGPQRPEAAQAIAIAAQVRRRQPGAIEQAEELARSLNAAEKAAQRAAEAERQAEAHRQRLEAEQAAKRAQEAAWLAGLAGTATPSPFGAGPATARGAAPESAETRAPEPRVDDQEQQRQDAFRALLERQQQAERERKEAPEQAPELDNDWGMDGP